MQGWNGWAKDHLQKYNAHFIDSLIPKQLIDLENQRIGLKVNKENNEIFHLFNDIKGHKVKEPEQRFIGEVSRLVASKWGLNGDLGYKVPYPHIPPDENPYRKIVVNLNELGHPGGAVKEHLRARAHENGERRMILPGVYHKRLIKTTFKRSYPYKLMSAIPLRRSFINSKYNNKYLTNLLPFKRKVIIPNKPYIEHYWSAVVSPNWFPSNSKYQNFVNFVKRDFGNRGSNLKKSKKFWDEEVTTDKTNAHFLPARDAIEIGERKNLIFSKCGMSGVYGNKGSFEVSIDDLKFKTDCKEFQGKNRSEYMSVIFLLYRCCSIL